MMRIKPKSKSLKYFIPVSVHIKIMNMERVKYLPGQSSNWHNIMMSAQIICLDCQRKKAPIPKIENGTGPGMQSRAGSSRVLFHI